MVKNRDHWTITAISRGGALTVTGRTGTVRLPTLYVRQHVELAYAETSHASQGVPSTTRCFSSMAPPTPAASTSP